MLTVEELVCLQRQVTLREACRHTPRHEALGEIMVRNYGAASPKDVQARIRRACAPRR
jgi:hypothetical protein